MTTPRSREDIENMINHLIRESKSNDGASAQILYSIHQILLDIRDLLTKKNPTDV